MVIQGFNVSVSSQRSSLSVQSGAITAANSQHSAQFSATVGQSGKNEKTPEESKKNQNKGNNDGGANSQGQNQNNNGNIGNGQNQNNNGNIGNGQIKNGNGNNQGNNGQIGNGQIGNGNTGNGQNVNNQGQRNRELFQALLDNAKEETVGRLVRGSSVSHVMNARGQKTPTTPAELRARLSQMIYEILTGRSSRFGFNQPNNIEDMNAGHQGNIVQSGQGINISGFFFGAFGRESLTQIQGIEGLRINNFEYESETVSYQAAGVVHTADGRTINIDINMNMSREFVSFAGLPGGSGTLVDPLVINYGGTAASLMGEKFLFDLTSDGNMDNLSILGPGNGFLAIDHNGDKKINDGSQLFGPNTGCGFNELRKYDTDGNGWIDENDEIFDKLVVWRRNEDGTDTVYTLKELGIGAIFLGDISTEFSFKSETNETLGVMRSTSFFIKQCGGAGTLSHIDLAL